LSYLNIFCISLAKLYYYFKNNDLSVNHRSRVTENVRVLSRAGFYHSKVIHTPKHSVLYSE